MTAAAALCLSLMCALHSKFPRLAGREGGLLNPAAQLYLVLRAPFDSCDITKLRDNFEPPQHIAPSSYLRSQWRKIAFSELFLG